MCPDRLSGIFGKFKDYLEFLTINKKLSKLLDDDLDIINCHEYHTFQSALIYKNKNKKVKTIGTLNDSPAMAGINKFEDGAFEFLVTKQKVNMGTYIKKMDKILVLDYLNQNYMNKFFNKEASVVRSGLNLEDF